MCGISGIISKVARADSHQRIRQMTAAIAHRGPDGEGYWRNESGNVHLGHRRLAIIDTSKEGAQPLLYAERYSIVHNGEIYNYLELKEKLQQHGYRFRTNTDTEIILAAFDKYGKDCLSQLDGMFAFAIWDNKEQALFAARDRMGEKPFYYYWDKQSQELLFASEPKAIKAAGITLEKDPAKELLFLGAGLTEPAHKGGTYFKHLLQIPAGSYLFYKPVEKEAQPLLLPWWSLNKGSQSKLSIETTLEKLNTLLTDSIRKRLRSDVPVGTSLSGGIDSSTIAALLHQMVGQSYKTFTAGFKDFEKDESAKAKKIADHFGFENFMWDGSSGPTIDELQKLIQHHEEPIGSASVWVQYKIYEMARANGISVLLDGQGADELFAGYPRYLHWYLQELIDAFKFGAFFAEKKSLQKNYPQMEWGWKNIPAAFLSELTAQHLQEKARNEITKNPYLSSDFVFEYLDDTRIEKPIVRELNDVLLFDCTSNGLPDLLRYADRNSMAHGVEVRLPFLQHDLVEWCFQLASSVKIHKGYTKWLLRKQAEILIPENIAWQTEKIGMEPPQQKWMESNSFREAIRESREQLIQKGIANTSIRNAPFDTSGAYEKNNMDWRGLVVAGLD